MRYHPYPLHDAAEEGDMETLLAILRPPQRTVNANKPTLALPAAPNAALPAAGGGGGEGGAKEERGGAAATAGGGEDDGAGKVREGQAPRLHFLLRPVLSREKGLGLFLMQRGGGG